MGWHNVKKRETVGMLKKKKKSAASVLGKIK
jgi:hypothetical protein